MYKRAIRMNAENRINAGNSWGLRLIENIDKFLVDENDDVEGDHYDDEQKTTTTTRQSSSSSGAEESTTTNHNTTTTTENKRVNFTKASCTLDASVKIYSYRVDDVHLTSYKVLANLNRTDTTKKSNKRNDHDDDDDEGGGHDVDDDDDQETTTTRTAGRRGGGTAAAETLESNVGAYLFVVGPSFLLLLSNNLLTPSNLSLFLHTANLNMNKLDSAYDIDPLFHKMSKTFDEGGAKGLLLVNLGVGNHGCKIIFDSKQDDEEQNNEQDIKQEEEEEEGMIDITSLSSKLESLLNGASMESFSIVPQLKTLREEHEKLESEGFVNDNVSKKRVSSACDDECMRCCVGRLLL
jgi:condensin complex subunit 2